MDNLGGLDNPQFIEEVKLGLKDAEEGRWVWDEDLQEWPNGAALLLSPKDVEEETQSGNVGGD